MKICSIASGSNGNCTFVSSGGRNILFDAGISARQIDVRLSSIGESLSCINAIFVSHEHTDHIYGLQILGKKYDIPLYMTRGTHKILGRIAPDIRHVQANGVTNIGNIKITSVAVDHDAQEPVGFVVADEKSTLGIFTDLGQVSSAVAETMDKLNALFIETNYDEHMLENNNRYPLELKKRIAGKRGHLSNIQASCSVLENASTNLDFVSLCHLSFNSNTQQIAYNTFMNMLSHREDLGHMHVSVTDRFACGKAWKI